MADAFGLRQLSSGPSAMFERKGKRSDCACYSFPLALLCQRF